MSFCGYRLFSLSQERESFGFCWIYEVALNVVMLTLVLRLFMVLDVCWMEAKQKHFCLALHLRVSSDASNSFWQRARTIHQGDTTVQIILSSGHLIVVLFDFVLLEDEVGGGKQSCRWMLITQVVFV